jgi:hypothetical protein
LWKEKERSLINFVEYAGNIRDGALWLVGSVLAKVWLVCSFPQGSWNLRNLLQ